MTIYFIDVRDSEGVVIDEEGGDFPGLEQALDEAKASARDLVRQYMDRHIALGAACVEVRDMQGRTVATLKVSEVLEHPIHPFFKNNCADAPDPGHR
jgi:hypothetical protein